MYKNNTLINRLFLVAMIISIIIIILSINSLVKIKKMNKSINLYKNEEEFIESVEKTKLEALSLKDLEIELVKNKLSIEKVYWENKTKLDELIKKQNEIEKSLATVTSESKITLLETELTKNTQSIAELETKNKTLKESKTKYDTDYATFTEQLTGINDNTKSLNDYKEAKIAVGNIGLKKFLLVVHILGFALSIVYILFYIRGERFTQKQLIIISVILTIMSFNPLFLVIGWKMNEGKGVRYDKNIWT